MEPHTAPLPTLQEARDRLLMTSAAFLLAPVSLVPREWHEWQGPVLQGQQRDERRSAGPDRA